MVIRNCKEPAFSLSGCLLNAGNPLAHNSKRVFAWSSDSIYFGLKKSSRVEVTLVLCRCAKEGDNVK
jgi:hypothetical protein